MDKKETQRDWAENIIDNIIAIEECCREAEKNKIGIDKKDKERAEKNGVRPTFPFTSSK